MKWTDLVQKVRDRSGASTAETRAVLEALVEEIVDALGSGEEVVVPGIVKLEPRWQEPRTVRSVRSRRRLALDGRFVPRVKAGARLKRVLAARTPQTWRDPDQQAAWRLAETLIGDLELYHRASVPTDLSPGLSTDDVEARCAAALGDAWIQARRAFESHVPEHVRVDGAHLPVVARRRWAHPDPRPMQESP